MLAILQFDAASASVLDRLLADGPAARPSPACASGATWHDLDAPATQFAAGAQHTLYSGVELADHGLFYPFQWSAADQRVHYMSAFEAPAAGVGAARPPRHPHAGRRPLREPAARRRRPRARWCAAGSCTTGSCCSSGRRPAGAHRRLERALRPARAGRRGVRPPHASTRCSACAAGCSARPVGWPTRPALLLGEQPFDLAWLTFCAAHVAGHQFWDLSQLDAATTSTPPPTPRARPHPRRRLRGHRRRPRPGRSPRCPERPT